VALTKVRGAGAEGLTLSSTALTVANGLTLTDGDIAVASGHGISFAADGSASGMSSELLHDYEEGTWTPAVTVGSNSTGTGNYRKIGGVVILRGYVSGFTNSSNNETLFITGLPFTPASNQAAGSAMWENINDDFKFDIVYVGSSDSRIKFFFAASGAYAELRHTHLDGSNAGCHFNATYLTDQ